MNRLINKNYWPAYAMIIISLGGVLMLLLDNVNVLKLTPLYLIINGVLLVFSFGSSKKLWAMILIAAIIGFAAEMIGVQTGIIFGDYMYGDILSAKVLDTPLMIGFMWALVMTVIWSLTPKSLGWKRIILTAIVAVIYDIVLEHFATRFGLWSWEGSIPLSNYVGWFIVATLISSIYHYKDYSLKPNPLSVITLPMHTVFFLMALLLLG